MNELNDINNPGRVHRFSFVSFDAEELPSKAVEPVVAVEETTPLEPVVTLQERIIKEEELHRAKQEGYEEGYKKGLAEAEAKFSNEQSKREAGIKAALELMANRITMASASHGAYLAQKQDVMNKAVLAIARKMAGEAIKAEPYSGIETMLRECVAVINGEPKVTITVPAGLAAGLKQRIDTLRPLLGGYNGELAVEESADLKENDCRVEWNSGYAVRDQAKLWSEIETIISRARVL